jgi:hypothetical protein
METPMTYRDTEAHGSKQPRSLDHVVVIVEDLEDSATRLEKIGFYVTARSDHPFGTSNRLVMLAGTYIELISLTDRDAMDDVPFARFVSDALAAGRTGPRLVVFRSDHPEADRERLAAEGVDAELLRFGRQARLPDETEVRVEFVTLVPPFGDDPVATFLCHHVTPEIVWHPSLLDHPNGARRLARVDLADPGAATWARIATMASAPTGPPVVAANAILDRGAPRLMIEGDEEATTTIAGTSVELVPSTD